MLTYGSGKGRDDASEHSLSGSESYEDSEEDDGSDFVPRTLPRRNRPARLQSTPASRRSFPAKTTSPAPLPPTEIGDVHKMFNAMKAPANPDEKHLQGDVAAKQIEIDRLAGQMKLDYPSETSERPSPAVPALNGNGVAPALHVASADRPSSPLALVHGLQPAAWKPASSPVASKSHCPADGSIAVNDFELNANGYVVEQEQNRMDTS
ncbi:hypothetical protein BDV98DRAFT_403160 [Pterulicium gracile]|uniref:Uncharacterized protein n=1 Tax=Pterulicium gracile TaxID=1884261 RepID=A0A5C3QLV7_9AGAR|nr:hypothetical protein BDV98DRAFT_403160 [Pterula gracilis]